MLRTLIEFVGLHARDDRGLSSARLCRRWSSSGGHYPIRGADHPRRRSNHSGRGPQRRARRLSPGSILPAAPGSTPGGVARQQDLTRVLRFLVAQRGRSVPRDALIEMFWPDADAESGRRNVHQMIYTIRKSLRGAAPPDEDSSEPPLIVFENDAYALNVQDGFWCDATEFETQVAAGRRAEAACRIDDAMMHYAQAQHLYRGDFLEDLPYDEWVLADRRHLRMLYIETVNRLAEARLDSGEIDEALELSQRLLNCDPCDESAHRRVMRCYARSGNRGMLTQQYEACADAMERVLGLAPDPKTVELYASLVNRN